MEAKLLIQDTYLRITDNRQQQFDISIMKFFLPILLALLFAQCVARQCGTFRMLCSNAAGACNNACYNIHCLNGGNNTFVNGPSPGLDNRVESGCKTTGKSPCKADAFAQRNYDQIDAPIGIFGRTTGKKLDCDEFPMNAFQQSAFVPGQSPRNSLRCIPSNENQSGGAQFLNFREEAGPWAPGRGPLAADRTCTGSMQPGDEFRMEFITSGIPARDRARLVPYCMPNPVCDNDGLQFHMVDLNKGRGKTGRLHKHYDYSINNRYAVTGAGEIRLYRIKILRTDCAKFAVEFFELVGKREYHLSMGAILRSIQPGQWGTVEMSNGGLPSQDLNIKSNGGPGTKLEFSVGELGNISFGRGDFEWATDSYGLRGWYCEMSKVNVLVPNPFPPPTIPPTVPNLICAVEQYIVCTFPGLA